MGADPEVLVRVMVEREIWIGEGVCFVVGLADSVHGCWLLMVWLLRLKWFVLKGSF